MQCALSKLFNLILYIMTMQLKTTVCKFEKYLGAPVQLRECAQPPNFVLSQTFNKNLDRPNDAQVPWLGLSA